MEDDAIMVQCAVCYTDYTLEELVRLECGHAYCRDCIHTWIQVSVIDGELQPRCPHPPCRKVMSEDFIQDTVQESVWDKYLRYKIIQQVDRNPDARWCPECDGAAVYRMKLCGVFKTEKAQCTECEQIWCFKCLGMVHEGPCAESHLPEEFTDWKTGKLVKRCPTCDRFVQKQDGCNHMTCVCGYQWCWICGGKYTKNHYKIYNIFGCPGMHFLAVRGITRNTSATRSLCRILMTLFSILIGFLMVALQVLIAWPLALFIFLMSHLCFFCCERYYDSMMKIVVKLSCALCFFLQDPPEFYNLGPLDGIV